MKCYVIRETTGYPTVIREGQVIQLGLGDQFTEDELVSLTCEVNVTYMCTDDNAITVQEPTAVQEPVAVPVTKVTKATKEAPVVESAPVEGVVPSTMETGSETSEA